MKKNRKVHTSFRLNILFAIVFLLFALLIIRLGVVQIVKGEQFAREVSRNQESNMSTSVPRGLMFDRKGKLVVDNEGLNAITYTRETGTSLEDMLKIAEKLSTMIEVETSKVRERDKKDYWIMVNESKARSKITQEEWGKYDNKKIDDKKIYELQLERISEKDLNTLTAQDMKTLAIYREMNSGYALTSQVLKNKNVTFAELAKINESLEELPGVDTAVDWNRSYPFGETLKTVLGKVSSSEKGIPKDKIDYYLSKGYSLNDRIGLSYLEMQYEDVLKGNPGTIQYMTNKAGKVLSSQIIDKGQRGRDLVLTIDMELQLTVEKIIEEELKAAKSQIGTSLLDRAYVILMEPKTGEILALAGKQITTDKESGEKIIIDDALGNITNSYNIGSVVKGATILAGYQTGAIKPGTQFYDTPMKIKGTPVKKSWTANSMGYLDDLMAIRRSSNVYMFKTAIEIGDGYYQKNQPLRLNQAEAFDKLRTSFSQFGLGVRTGIDLPNETIGFKGMDTKPGFVLDLSIGQYDTYSNMQMAQYISTIANDGLRMQPHLVKEIREPNDEKEIGPIITEIQPTAMNRIDMKKEWVDRVQLGFKQVMQAPLGTGVSYFGDTPYSPAGKTGTAEAFYDGPLRSKFGTEPPEVINLSLAGYAPSDHPQIAMAVLVPWAYQGNIDHHANMKIGRKVMDAYFELNNPN